MKLVDVQIKELIQEQIIKLIRKSTYKELHQYIVAKQSISAINKEITSQLFEVFREDLGEEKKRLTEDAYRKQIESDKHEAQIDIEEAAIIGGETRALEQQLGCLDQEARDLYSSSLEQETIVYKIMNSYFSKSEKQDLLYGRVLWKNFRHDNPHHFETLSVEERNKLDNQLKVERASLNQIKHKMHATNNQIESIQLQLNRDIPNRTCELAERRRLRDNRNKISEKHPTDPGQLSKENAALLEYEIVQYILDLDSLYKNLKSEDEESGYSMFVSVLKEELMNPEHFSPSEAKSLLPVMEQSERFPLLQVELKQLYTELEAAKNQYNEFESKRRKCTDAFHDALDESIAVKKEQVEIGGSVFSIQQKINALIPWGKGSAVMLGVSNIATAINFGVIVTFATNPLLFLIPAFLGIATLIVLGFALKFVLEKKEYDSKLVDLKIIELDCIERSNSKSQVVNAIQEELGLYKDECIRLELLIKNIEQSIDEKQTELRECEQILQPSAPCSPSVSGFSLFSGTSDKKEKVKACLVEEESLSEVLETEQPSLSLS